MPGTLTATNLAVHHHLRCDLYLHYTYFGAPTTNGKFEVTALSKALFEKGNKWESFLLSWLHNEGLLLRLDENVSRDGREIAQIIDEDSRNHFFITGLAFAPPTKELEKEYGPFGPDRTIKKLPHFGTAKPDLVEVDRRDGTTTWQVIDAKASMEVKVSHYVQIYFYHLCLQHLIRRYSDARPSTKAGVWLQGSYMGNSDTPLTSIRIIPISLMEPLLRQFLFVDVPGILRTPRMKVKWHYNALCRGCPFELECRSRTSEESTLGAIANLSIDEADLLQDVLTKAKKVGYMKGAKNNIGDIEDLGGLVEDKKSMRRLENDFPSALRKTRRILGLPDASKDQEQSSARLDAALTKDVQIFGRRLFTFPKEEDIAIVISLIEDPSTEAIVAFCISVFSAFEDTTRIFGRYASDLIPCIAFIIKDIMDRYPQQKAQFYVFSPRERATLQQHLINAALESDLDMDKQLFWQTRLCVGALCEGASLLSTVFQPVLLRGALLSFLHKKNVHTKAELRTCLERLGLPTDGTSEEMRERIQETLNSLSPSEDNSLMEVGQLPQVVVVKREMNRLMALPVPGYWDLPECAIVLLNASSPSDDEIFVTWKDRPEDDRLLEDSLLRRNDVIYDVIQAVRQRVQVGQTDSVQILVNEARVLRPSFMDICRHANLRKLFFMQQFEVLTRLAELWQSRIDGCPEAPVLEFFRYQKEPQPDGRSARYLYSFHLITGSVEVSGNRERSFYDYILTEDIDPMEDRANVPVEALFDDLTVSGQVFPLNRNQQHLWEKQHPEVQERVWVADVVDTLLRGRRTVVTLHTFSKFGVLLKMGRRYRLSSRLIDFNLSKTLSALAELDFKTAPALPGGYADPDDPPFVHLITHPNHYTKEQTSEEAAEGRLIFEDEKRLYTLFAELKNLGTENAANLLPMFSQRLAVKRILSKRITVVWGPPGTGKTYTLAMAVLRMIHIRSRLGHDGEQFIILLTAMTHAAIKALLDKIELLSQYYRSIKDLDLEWLDDLQVQHVTSGHRHPAPVKDRPYILAGTVFQLFTFARRCHFDSDCVIIDEAGQLSLSLASLVLRSLRLRGKVVVAGDTEQLAPILAASYPRLDTMLFGSVLECFMGNRLRDDTIPTSPPVDMVADPTLDMDVDISMISLVIQLTENFRLNPDLGDFVSTIYAKKLDPMPKKQTRSVAVALRNLWKHQFIDAIDQQAQDYLVALGSAMLGSAPGSMTPPRMTAVPPKTSPSTRTPRASHRNLDQDEALVRHTYISLALIRLSVISTLTEAGYEAHVRAEASLAAALVRLLQKALPEEDIFVATPHRVQRHAVRAALYSELDELAAAMAVVSMDEGERSESPAGKMENVRVDTIERLQGSEASFVICLFSHPHGYGGGSSGMSTNLAFLLDRRRLNVAISRAKTLCLLVSSDAVLNPSVRVLSSRESVRGFQFIKQFEARAWSGKINVDIDQID